MTKWLIRILAVWGIIFVVLMTIDSQADRIARAIIGMTWGLIILWIVVGGLLTLRFRESIKRRVLNLPINWRLKFVLFAILLALIEEAITTLMTNLAPVFGVQMGEAAITASANYFEVVFFHSVIVFVPMFICWAWLLGHYAFNPHQVFLLFGLTGVLSESISFGFQNLLSAGFWVFVYGLMVYLPAYTLPDLPSRRSPNLLHFILALSLPILFAVPVVLLLLMVRGAT